jgi:arylsulfatase A-like enzyme
MSGFTRRRFLQTSAGAVSLAGVPAAGALASATAADATAAASPDREGSPGGTSRPSGGKPGKRPNIVLLFTDQQRQPQHWPAGFVAKHLPSFARLQRHGLTFENAFTAACQCTPSRATMLTGTYPTVHGVTQTFSTNLVGSGVMLQTFQQNLCRLLGGAGYHVEYKGKWHESLPIGADWTEADAAHLAKAYGAMGWNGPDAGNSITDVTTLGGADPNNDGRYVSGMTPGAKGQTKGFGTSIVDFLRAYDGEKPFCLIASLVNPHDIEFMPNGWDKAGYRAQDFEHLGIALPQNFDDGLATKPTIQSLVRDIKNGVAPLSDDKARSLYVNFYAYLQTVVDRHLMTILDALDARGFTEDTVILRFADHGEGGLSHGMREKSWTAYEEMIHVPLIVSCPAWYDSPRETKALYSHVDLLPTVATLAGVPQSTLDAMGCVGRDLGPVLRDPTAEVQDAVLFAFEDNSAFIQRFKLPSRVPTQIRALREKDWTYAVYFTPDGSNLQYELYDLKADPGQMKNLAHEPSTGGASVEKERRRLHAKLAQRLVDSNAAPLGFRWPSDPFATGA